jgi:hypothetical protein
MSDTDAATAESVAVAQSYRDSLESLRTRTDTAAKALAALGTAGLTAVGIQKVTDVFPYPDGGAPFVVLGFVGFLTMVVVIVCFTVRLYTASEALNTSSDPDRMTRNVKERAQIRTIYNRMALLNDHPTLLRYERSAQDMQSLADAETDNAKRRDLGDLAARMRAEIRATQASAAHAVISARLRRTLSDVKTKTLGVVFIGALLTFGLAVNWLDSERTAQAAALKGCADAITAKVPTGALPKFCKAAVPEAPTGRTGAQHMASHLSNMAALYSTCVDTALQDKQPLTTCDSIRKQLGVAAK